MLEKSALASFAAALHMPKSTANNRSAPRECVRGRETAPESAAEKAALARWRQEPAISLQPGHLEIQFEGRSAGKLAVSDEAAFHGIPFVATKHA